MKGLGCTCPRPGWESWRSYKLQHQSSSTSTENEFGRGALSLDDMRGRRIQEKGLDVLCRRHKRIEEWQLFEEVILEYKSISLVSLKEMCAHGAPPKTQFSREWHVYEVAILQHQSVNRVMKLYSFLNQECSLASFRLLLGLSSNLQKPLHNIIGGPLCLESLL